MFKRLFKEHGVKNVITIFHKPSSPSSKRVLDLLKQHQTTPAATQNDNKASNHTSQNQAGRNANFELDVSEANPTSDQLRSILDFVGDQNIGELIPGEKDSRRAIEKMAQDAESFQRPVVVDWNGGKAVIGDKQTEILKLLQSLKKD